MVRKWLMIALATLTLACVVTTEARAQVYVSSPGYSVTVGYPYYGGYYGYSRPYVTTWSGYYAPAPAWSGYYYPAPVTTYYYSAPAWSGYYDAGAFVPYRVYRPWRPGFFVRGW